MYLTSYMHSRNWISVPFLSWDIEHQRFLQIENKPTRPPPISPSISNFVHFTYPIIPGYNNITWSLFFSTFTEWQKVNNPTHFHNSAVSIQTVFDYSHFEIQTVKIDGLYFLIIFYLNYLFDLQIKKPPEIAYIWKTENKLKYI